MILKIQKKGKKVRSTDISLSSADSSLLALVSDRRVWENKNKQTKKADLLEVHSEVSSSTRSLGLLHCNLNRTDQLSALQRPPHPLPPTPNTIAAHPIPGVLRTFLARLQSVYSAHLILKEFFYSAGVGRRVRQVWSVDSVDEEEMCVEVAASRPVRTKFIAISLSSWRDLDSGELAGNVHLPKNQLGVVWPQRFHEHPSSSIWCQLLVLQVRHWNRISASLTDERKTIFLFYKIFWVLSFFETNMSLSLTRPQF